MPVQIDFLVHLYVNLSEKQHQHTTTKTHTEKTFSVYCASSSFHLVLIVKLIDGQLLTTTTTPKWNEAINLIVQNPPNCI